MTRRRTVTEQAATAAIEQGCRMPRLPTIRDRFVEIAAAAEREQMTYLGFLSELVIAECDDRTRRRAERRIRDAGFPRPKRLEEFSFEPNPAINPAVIAQLATCAWVKAGHPLCLIGDSGTGKSHLLIALGTLAAEAGYRVRYTLASKLVNELVEAADDKQLTKLINRYGRVDLILVDLYRSGNYAEVQVTFSERLCGGGSLVNWGCAVVGMITGIPGMPAPRPWAGSALVVWRPGR
ncbi:MAG TPA: ATP-binding protein [Mycobacterium sp.]|nr:ATP-binding protein [Mycobacterium sp.]HUH67622.1 ATP-binding protein [Mycobacterium sp.]